MKPSEQSFDLPRLDATAQPVLSEAVATLRGNGPDATQLASLASRLALAGVDVTLPTPAPKRPPLRWKKWLAGGGAASGALIWLAMSTKPPAPHASDPNQASHALAVEARAHAPSSAVSAAPRAKTGTALDSPAPTPAAPQPTLPLATTSEALDREPARLTAPEALSPNSAAQPATPHALSMAGNALSHAASGAAAPVTSNPSGVTPEAQNAPTEIELLRDARLALKQAPARALTLVEAHARAYPGGKLTQERELIGISALVALGRRTAALSRGARFQHDFPSSPYRDQVEQLLR